MIDIQITPRKPKLTIISEDPSGKDINIDVGDLHPAPKYSEYEGPTTVTPEAYDMQILQTEKTSVMENIVVLPIPMFRTSNPQGGTTVYIGE